MNLLHIDSSALGAHSVSRELGRAIVDAWKRAHPGATVTYRDVAAHPLPHWTPVADAADPAARLGGEVLDEFLAADVVVIGAPMYNFSVPSTLKTWIDRVAVAGKTFRYGANGPEGLAGDKQLIIVSSRGGFYSAGTPGAAADFQEAYLRQVFGFLGVTDIEIIRAEGVNISAEQKAQAIAAAHAAIGANERVAA
ncbi:FMN-dependent NADH-azoreductase [Dokdonella soli]|uniref:FMN dependent NADH:quinone oxidoreductase n=1 Tax=Dokdonella soli TaxID=529810 RepID=A0ABN1IWW5_9GAMM